MVKNRVKVSICNVSYSLIADDNEEQSHIFQAAAYVDTSMKSVLKIGGNLADTEKAAVLCALQCASALLKSEAHMQLISKEIMHLIEKVDEELAFSY